MDLRGKRELLGAVFGLLAVIVFSVLYSYAASQDPGYTFLENYLSDLGVGPAAWAFNSALMLSGTFMTAFSAVGMYPLVDKSMLTRIGPVLLAASGVLLVLVGVFTEDYDDTHLWLSLAFFLTLLSSLGALTYSMHATQALGRIGTAVSAAAFVFGLYLSTMEPGPFSETLAVITAELWGAIISSLMLFKATRAPA